MVLGENKRVSTNAGEEYFFYFRNSGVAPIKVPHSSLEETKAV